jgi:hypothetical protein
MGRAGKVSVVEGKGHECADRSLVRRFWFRRLRLNGLRFV